jgi:hypothetical protein
MIALVCSSALCRCRYWWHDVETLSEAISVNVWTDADELLHMDSIYSLPVHELPYPGEKVFMDFMGTGCSVTLWWLLSRCRLRRLGARIGLSLT